MAGNVSEDSTESADFDTVTETCVFCQVDVQDGDGIFCDDCGGHFHWSCRNIPVAKTTKKPPAAVRDVLELAYIAVFCDRCTDARKSGKGRRRRPDSGSEPTEAALKGICEEIAIIKTALLGPPPASSSSGKSWAKVAGSRPAPGLVHAFSTGARQSSNEELRHRSVVIDGVPLVEGECDREKLDAFVKHCGLSNHVRIVEHYRMGPVSSTGFPPKIKVVLATNSMQRLLLEKRIRDAIASPVCPAPFSKAFINPSRTWEERRALMKLRRRRSELNSAIPDKAEQWFVNYTKFSLVKRVGGQPAWDDPGDVGWAQWDAEFERANPPRRGRAPATNPNNPRPSFSPKNQRPSQPPPTIPAASPSVAPTVAAPPPAPSSTATPAPTLVPSSAPAPKPVPVATKPAPVATKRAPVATKPAPVPTKPASQSDKSPASGQGN